MKQELLSEISGSHGAHTGCVITQNSCRCTAWQKPITAGWKNRISSFSAGMSLCIHGTSIMAQLSGGCKWNLRGNLPFLTENDMIGCKKTVANGKWKQFTTRKCRRIKRRDVATASRLCTTNVFQFKENSAKIQTNNSRLCNLAEKLPKMRCGYAAQSPHWLAQMCHFPVGDPDYD